MQLFTYLTLILILKTYSAAATFSELFQPFKALLSWTHPGSHGNISRFKLESARPVQQRPRIEYLTPGVEDALAKQKLVEFNKDDQGHPALVIEDLHKQSPSVSPVSLIPADLSTSSTLPPSAVVTSTVPPASSLGPRSSPASRTSSASSSLSRVTSSRTETNSFHMVDLRIPGGESPDTEALPDVAIFQPEKPLESGDKQSVNAQDYSKITRGPPSATSTLTTSDGAWIAFKVASPTTATVSRAVTEGSSASRLTTEESARESVRFVQTIRRPVQTRVVQDVNELFQLVD